MRSITALSLLSLTLCAACRSADPEPLGPEELVPIVGGTDSSSSSSSGSSGTGTPPIEGSPAVRLGTWNLHNFSKWGSSEYRITDIADEVERLDADVLGVQELKVATDTEGEPPQAWDVLLGELEEYAGLHAPWSTFDTTVGLLYKPATTTVVDSRTLFEDDGYAFPRPPLEATLAIIKDDVEVEIRVVVLHLKAFGDSVDRRRAACDKLDGYLSETPEARVVLLGDLNDDPHDPPAENAFAGTFLDAEPTYHFVTHALPPESVTSLGHYHEVDGMQIDGEFLDHFILTGAAMSAFHRVTPTIASVPMADRGDFEGTHSDHFPVLLDLEP